jgi:hypothetical protein
VGVPVDRDGVARQGDEAGRDQDRAQREHDRQERRDECGEREPKDHKRQRNRDAFGPLEVLADGVVERLTGGRLAELLDAELRGRLRDSLDRIRDGLNALVGGVGLALHREEHDGRAAVGTDLAAVAGREWVLHVLDPVRGRDRRCDGAGGPVPSRRADASAPARLEQDLLGGRLLEATALEQALCLRRVACGLA